ncbi:MAG: hypothetical protein A2Y53_05605 [Chloroflexi bacterium RBG_16_47_49]|nr:MAG: hypothetical protein A2Y53_05605 [Chloroflexi bacterium RBG_16_47_49]
MNIRLYIATKKGCPFRITIDFFRCLLRNILSGEGSRLGSVNRTGLPNLHLPNHKKVALSGIIKSYGLQICARYSLPPFCIEWRLPFSNLILDDLITTA